MHREGSGGGRWGAEWRREGGARLESTGLLDGEPLEVVPDEDVVLGLVGIEEGERGRGGGGLLENGSDHLRSGGYA